MARKPRYVPTIDLDQWVKDNTLDNLTVIQREPAEFFSPVTKRNEVLTKVDHVLLSDDSQQYQCLPCGMLWDNVRSANNHQNAHTRREKKMEDGTVREEISRPGPKASIDRIQDRLTTIQSDLEIVKSQLNKYKETRNPNGITPEELAALREKADKWDQVSNLFKS